MKYLVILSIFLGINILHSQDLSITYEFDSSIAKKELDTKIKNNKNEVNQGTLLVRDALDLLHCFTFTLKIDESKSHFFLNNDLGNDNIDPTTYAVAKTIANKGEFYQDNIKNVVLIKKTSFGESFLIEKSLNNIEWKISNIEDTIFGYKTYKATTTITDLKKGGGYKDIEIEVWFTPEIPVSFGPEGFGGLPGLILKKCQGNICFDIVNINKENNIISFPKGERTSFEDYNKFLEKIRAQREF